MIASLALAAAIFADAAPAQASTDLLKPVSEPRIAVAVLNCLVKNDGHLTACTVQDESPNDLGVGQAALSMASRSVSWLSRRRASAFFCSSTSVKEA